MNCSTDNHYTNDYFNKQRLEYELNKQKLYFIFNKFALDSNIYFDNKVLELSSSMKGNLNKTKQYLVEF